MSLNIYYDTGLSEVAMSLNIIMIRDFLSSYVTEHYMIQNFLT